MVASQCRWQRTLPASATFGLATRPLKLIVDPQPCVRTAMKRSGHETFHPVCTSIEPRMPTLGRSSAEVQPQGLRKPACIAAATTAPRKPAVATAFDLQGPGHALHIGLGLVSPRCATLTGCRTATAVCDQMSRYDVSMQIDAEDCDLLSSASSYASGSQRYRPQACRMRCRPGHARCNRAAPFVQPAAKVAGTIKSNVGMSSSQRIRSRRRRR